MTVNNPDIAYASTVGLMFTYRCSVSCDHCIVEAGPHRKETVPVDEALGWIDQVAVYGEGHVCGLALTGGEPFLKLSLLRSLSARAHERGLAVSAVTNAFWARSPKASLEILGSIPSLSMVSLSTDAYHLKEIPFENIKNAVHASEELGLLFNVAVCTEDENSPEHQSVINDLLDITDMDHIRVSIAYPAGRALNVSMLHKMKETPTVSACTMASSPVIFPEGRVMGCIGPVLTLKHPHPMALGNIREESLESILDRAELNPVIHALRVWGPHKLIQLMGERGLDHLIPSAFISGSTCDVCFRLFSDPDILKFLDELARDIEFTEKVAYARVFYLKEEVMASALNLG